MDTNGPARSRAERRRNSERRILEAARRIFGELGYERTTMRTVAKAAEVDPALIMQYFGSKEGLFRQVVRIDTESMDADATEPLSELLLAGLGVKLAGMPATSLTMLRSMLTHPEAASEMRAVFGQQIKQIAAVLPDDEDADLRAALLITAHLGVVIGRHLLELDPLRDASPEKIVDLLQPGFRTLAADPDAG
ncbi:TetR/AcrR family transcriptional regulator [Kitasatospora sp. NPDC127116]|uniref:TetR/AcrR family transcriptional regulator n=1 Tax=Kitasatospora sp. NPDC127116 TaxID=3345367 RepID=UPI0033755407